MKPYTIFRSYSSIEGAIVSVADEIAQRHHDIEDGLSSGLINQSEIIDLLKDSNIKIQYPKNLLKELEEEPELCFFISLLGKKMIKLYENCYCRLLQRKMDKYGKSNNTLDQLRNFLKDKEINFNTEFGFSNSLKKFDKKIKDFLENRIIESYTAQSMDGKSKYIIKKLFEAYLTNPQQLPDKTILHLYINWIENPDDTLIKRINKVYFKKKGK